MTLELLQKPTWFRVHPIPYLLGGVKEITDQTEYGEGHFSITIFDRKVFYMDAFEHVKCIETGEYFVKDGKWVGGNV